MIWIANLSVATLAESLHVVYVYNTLATSDAEGPRLIQGAHLVDLATTILTEQTAGCDIFPYVLRAPNLNDSIILTRC